MKCIYCINDETILHIPICPAVTPVSKFLIRKLITINEKFRKMPIHDIFTLNFKLKNSLHHSLSIWLIGEISLAIWKSRKKFSNNILKDVITQLKIQ